LGYLGSAADRAAARPDIRGELVGPDGTHIIDCRVFYSVLPATVAWFSLDVCVCDSSAPPCFWLVSGSFLARFWRVGGQAHATNVAPPGFASAMQQLVNTVHWGLARGVGATVGGRILARTNGTRAWHEKLLPTFRLN